MARRDGRMRELIRDGLGPDQWQAIDTVLERSREVDADGSRPGPLEASEQESIKIISRSNYWISELVQAVKGYTHMDRATEQLRRYQ